MVELLLANHWVVFATVAGVACVAVVAIAAGLVHGRAAGWLMLASIALLLLAGRWPTVLMPGEMNADESLMLAQALKFTADPVPWRSIDPGTGGPLNSYALLPLHWLGMPLGYPLARWTAIVCLFAYLGLLFLAMRRLAGVRIAAVVVLPAAVMHAVASRYDSMHYSSELASLAAIGLLAFATARLAQPGLERRAEWWRSFIAGVCAFLVTMSKLQGVPLAATLAFSLVALTSPGAAAFARRIAGMAAGAAAGVALLLVTVVSAGVFADFRISFLGLPFMYATSPLSSAQLPEFVRMSPEAHRYAQMMAWSLGATALASFAWLRHEGALRIALRVASIALVLLGLFLTLTKPGRMFPHYLSYLTVAGCALWLFVLPWERPTRERDREAGHGNGNGT